MSTTRKETDLLGSREVLADAYWGIHTLRALENYQISGIPVGHYPDFVISLVQVKLAAARANQELGVIKEDTANAIIAACERILNERCCLDQFPIDLFQGGAGTSVNMNTNEVIANLALEMTGHAKGEYKVIHPMDDVNHSQSTNDVYPTALRLAIYNHVQKLRQELALLVSAFATKGEEFRQVLKMGRTQLQDAVPMTLGQEMQAFADNLAEEDARLENNALLLLECNLGATAIGTRLNAPAGYQEAALRHLRKITGYDIQGAKNLIEATSDTGAYVSMHTAIKRLAVKLSKICNDLRLLSSGPRAGLHEINLPARAAGSSIMPAKVNPVIPEVVNQVCFKIIGNDFTITMAAEAGQLQLNVMEPVIAQSMFESLHLALRGCATLRERCIDGITANAEVCRNHVYNSIGIITFFNNLIGHEMGDKIGEEAARTGRSVRDLLLEHKLLSEAQIDAILSPENLAHAGVQH